MKRGSTNLRALNCEMFGRDMYPTFRFRVQEKKRNEECREYFAMRTAFLLNLHDPTQTIRISHDTAAQPRPGLPARPFRFSLFLVFPFACSLWLLALFILLYCVAKWFKLFFWLLPAPINISGIVVTGRASKPVCLSVRSRVRSGSRNCRKRK